MQMFDTCRRYYFVGKVDISSYFRKQKKRYYIFVSTLTGIHERSPSKLNNEMAITQQIHKLETMPIQINRNREDKQIKNITYITWISCVYIYDIRCETTSHLINVTILRSVPKLLLHGFVHLQLTYMVYIFQNVESFIRYKH